MSYLAVMYFNFKSGSACMVGNCNSNINSPLEEKPHVAFSPCKSAYHHLPLKWDSYMWLPLRKQVLLPICICKHRQRATIFTHIVPQPQIILQCSITWRHLSLFLNCTAPSNSSVLIPLYSGVNLRNFPGKALYAIMWL